jgi:hypothetical protein
MAIVSSSNGEKFEGSTLIFEDAEGRYLTLVTVYSGDYTKDDKSRVYVPSNNSIRKGEKKDEVIITLKLVNRK